MPPKISEILDGVYDRDIGWRPASGSIKPVHLANGLLRELQGGFYDLEALNRFLVWWRRGKVADDSRSLEALLDDEWIGPRIAGLRGRRQEFERLRRYALGLLNADRALFPSADHSTYSLTTGVMVTRDTNDRRLGSFAAALYGERGHAPFGEVLKRCAVGERPLDPVTALVWPLLPTPGDLRAATRNAQTEGSGRKGALRRPFQGEILDSLGDGVRTLFTHETEQGNRLRTLERGVLFACVATFAHAQALSSDGKLQRRPPGLLAIGGHKHSEIAVASERSVERIMTAFEGWLGTRLAVQLREGIPLGGDETAIDLSLDGRSARAILRKIADAKGRVPTDDLVAERMAVFAAQRRTLGDADPADILAATLVACYLQEYDSGGPRPFLQGLTRRAGLLYPHFQGRSREKRLRPSVAIWDMLVRACVASGESLPLDDFLERLWMRFGLIVGVRRNEDWDDHSFLEGRGLSVDPMALRKNGEDLVDQLVLMGMARRFPDSVTFIGEGHVR